MLFLSFLFFIQLALSITTNECFLTLSNPNDICSLNSKGCLCNQAFVAMVPNQVIQQILTGCGFPPVPTCIPQYTYGCPVTDDVVDISRLGTFLSYINYLTPIYNQPYETSCFDKTKCINKIGMFMKSNVQLRFPLGLGSYTGLGDICDYLGLPAAGISRGLFFLTSTPSPNDYAVFGPTSLTLGTMNTTSYALTKQFSNLFNEYTLNFDPCDFRLSLMEFSSFSNILNRPTDIWQFAGAFYQAARYKIKQFNAYDICNNHEKYCKGPNQQYKNFGECRKYINSLPTRASGCSVGEMIFGPSQACKIKHSQMVAINPDLHCMHIGPIGTNDTHGTQKCVQKECTNKSFPITWDDLDALDFSDEAKFFRQRGYLVPKVCDSGTTQPPTIHNENDDYNDINK